MKALQKFGGFSALYLATAYILGMIGFLTVVDVSSVADPVEQIALMAENFSFLYIMYIFVYVIWGVLMVVLSLAIYDRLKANSPAIAQVAAVLGVFWGCVILLSGMIHNVGMQAVVDLYGSDPLKAGTIWSTIDVILGGLAGSNEAIGGLWITLLSAAALRGKEFPQKLNYLGLAVGAAGVFSIIPTLDMFIYIFATSQIVWFVWLGITMLRGRHFAVASGV